MSQFDSAFLMLLGNEGGYSNHPADPGGETMWGITKRVAVANGYNGPMRDLPLETAKQIAKTQYWDKVQGDAFPFPVAFMLFDTIYNGGHPVQWLQKAVGATVDGVIGPETIRLANSADAGRVAAKFTAYRMKYITSLGRDWFANFGAGLMNRLADNILKTLGSP